MNRKPCKTSNGRRARARGRVRRAGQTYRAVSIPHAMHLKTILIPYTARGGIMHSWPALLLGVVRGGASPAREEEGVSALLRPQRCRVHTPRALPPQQDGLIFITYHLLACNVKSEKKFSPTCGLCSAAPLGGLRPAPGALRVGASPSTPG